MTHRRFTVMPFLMAMLVAVAGMPTDVVQVNYGEMGIEHTQPWRTRTSLACTRIGHRLMARLRALLIAGRGHPLTLPATALGAVLLIAVIAPAHLHGASFAVVGTVNIKQILQDEADNKAAQARVKADLGKLLDVAARDRTDAQKADMATKKTEFAELEASAVTIAEDLALARKLQVEEKQSTGTVAVHDNASDKPATLGEVMQAMAYQKFKSTGRDDKAAFILPAGVSAHVVAAIGGPDKLFAAASGASSGNAESGGVLVKNEWSTSLLNRVQEQGKLAPRCFDIPIGEGNDGLEAPFVDETSRATGSRWGGVQVYRAAEAAAMTSAQPKLGKFELRLEDLVGLFYATDRVLRDATLLQALAEKAFASEFAFRLDDEIIRGTGAGQCLGIIGNAPTVSVAKETNQAASTVVFENILKMYSVLLARCMPGAEWFVNQTVLPQLFKMYLAVGTAGVPVYLPANGASASPYGTLMGLPVNVIEQAAAVGTVGDIILANLHNDYALISKPMMSASSIHVLFTSNQTTFRWVWPVIGKPVLSSAITPYKGSATFGPFVTLATRP